ncbi:MAG: hypothetical protein AAGG02_12685 [Cyanobacteria bacterium P01_H01_bin.15]
MGRRELRQGARDAPVASDSYEFSASSNSPAVWHSPGCDTLVYRAFACHNLPVLEITLHNRIKLSNESLILTADLAIRRLLKF